MLLKDETTINAKTPEEIHIAMPWGIIAARSWNSRSSQPMLVLHGADDNAGSFDALIPRLLPDYHYLCVDLPGHGFSSSFTPGVPLSFIQFISALQRLVRFFDWTSFSIMAHSFGTQLAIVLAAAETHKVKRLILLDGTCGSPLSDEVFVTRCTAELQELLESENEHRARPQLTTYEQVVEKRTSRAFSLSPEAAHRMLCRELVATQKGVYRHCDFRSCYRTIAHMSENVQLYNCRTINCPVLLIFAKDSLMLQIHDSEFHQKILKIFLSSHRSSRIVQVEGGHNVHCDSPENVASALNQFLNDTKDIKSTVRSKV